ncbi:ABC transporter [bacterium SCN 62-11]|nr:ABC transporter ATP-binding protein [Candidatus Eremiobacteraeota bacterium]ODT74569.1 MAG: ABC transporter [bacterium SCN 62-11]
MAILRAENVVKTYERAGASSVEALRGVTLRVEAGEFVAVTGASGSGKSTLLTVLSGLDLPNAGSIHLDGIDVTQAHEEDLAGLRNRKIGFLFQDFHLVPSLTAWENVAFPAELAGEKTARERARALLERVGLSQRLESFPHQLSGGEKQRVALCRAVINRPALLFADEPTGNLDTRNGQEVVRLLLDLKAESGSTLVLVTHSDALAAQADRVLVMSDGRIL